MNSKALKKMRMFFTGQELIRLTRRDVFIKNTDKQIHHVYFLFKGYVQQCYRDKNEEIVMDILKPNSIFPVSFLVNSMSNKYFYRAATDVELYRAPYKKVIRFIRENSDVLFDLTSQLSLGLNHMLDLTSYLRVDEARARIYELLLFMGMRFGTRKDKYLVLNIPLTHQEIAAFVGMRRETVSREMAALARSRKIKIADKHIWVLRKSAKKSVK